MRPARPRQTIVGDADEPGTAVNLRAQQARLNTRDFRPESYVSLPHELHTQAKKHRTATDNFNP